ncbi:MAG: Mur ligase family protein [bacterium]
MKISLNKLTEITTVISTNNVKKDETFDYVRITKIFNDEFFLSANNPLFIPMYIDSNSFLEGWYIDEIDNRKYINDYINKFGKKVVYLIDSYTEKLLSTDCKYIVVQDLKQTINNLTNLAISNFEGKKILVTGSVGKTTLAGLIEEVIDDNVYRIYSKRITPLNFASHMINHIDNSVKYLVMESALYREFHVEYYSKLLKPDIGVIINILPAHLGVDNMNTLDDLLASKARLLLHSSNVIVNMMDENISKLTFDDNVIKLENRLIGNHSINKIVSVKEIRQDLIPFVETKLSKLQNQLAFEVGKLLEINTELIKERINNYKPVEMRLIKANFNDREVIFCGEVSTVPRIIELASHDYSNCVLVLRMLTIDGENEYDFKPLMDIFSNFDKVYLFNDIHEKSLFDHDNVEIVNNHSFIEDIDLNTKIIYHHGSYYRKKFIPIDDRII